MSQVKQLLIGLPIVLAFVCVLCLAMRNYQDHQKRFLNTGIAAYRNGDYANAIEQLQQDMRTPNADPSEPVDDHYYLGLCFLKESRPSEASQELQKALDTLNAIPLVPGSGRSGNESMWRSEHDRISVAMSEASAQGSISQSGNAQNINQPSTALTPYNSDGN